MLLPEYLDEIGEAEARRVEVDATIKGATSSSPDENDDDTNDEEDTLSAAELAALKKELTAAKKMLKTLEQEFVVKLTAARIQLLPDDDQSLVLGISRSDLIDHLNAYVSKHRQLVTAALENWWDKYAVTLRGVETDRSEASAKLDRFLEELGYA